MPAAADVGVAIATHNRARDLERTLARLTALPERPAIAVADNGSSDGTSTMVRECFPSVRLVELAQNHGPEARTVALRTLATRFVAFSDDDSWWAPGALATGAAILSRHPRLGLLAARVLVGPDDRLDPTCKEMRASPLPQRPEIPYPAVLGFIACGSIVRRDAYLSVGGFAPIGFAAEETLLALDLAAAGWALAYADPVVAHHHPSSSRRPQRRRVDELRNQALIAWLRRPLARAMTETARLAARAATEGAARTALGELLTRLPAALAERRPAPASVERALVRIEGPSSAKRRDQRRADAIGY